MKFMLVVLLFGVLVYAAIRMVQRRGSGGASFGPARRPPAPPTRPTRSVAPDDDEQFLRDLDRKRRHNGDPPPG